jgi:hypothetical protein
MRCTQAVKDDSQSDQPREKTPKGLEIRIPTRGDFFRNLKKILRLPSTPDRPKK